MFTGLRVLRRGGLAAAAVGLGVMAMGHATPALALTFFGMQAQFSYSSEGTDDFLSLLINEAAFGMDGFGIGAVGQVTPDDNMPVRWVAVGLVGQAPPDDSMPAVRFKFESANEVSGVSPQPFRSLVMNTDTGDFLYELDFTQATGVLGSLTLSNVGYYLLDDSGAAMGERLTFETFTVTAIPLPAALPLFLGALGGLGLIGWRRRRAVA